MSPPVSRSPTLCAKSSVVSWTPRTVASFWNLTDDMMGGLLGFRTCQKNGGQWS